MSKVMVLDIETENHPYYGAIASPRHPENYVVAVGYAVDNGAVFGEYYNSKAESANWLRIPEDVGMLVAHNAPFEMDWMLHTAREETMRFLARGGRVFCTALAEYLLSNQQTTYPDLNSTAPKYGGTHKVDGIKLLWEQGNLTSQIDKALLYDEYLVGPSGDIENTRKVYQGQMCALAARGMLDMAFVRMEGLLYNCFAMYSGLYVNREVAFAQKADVEQKIAEISGQFVQFRQNIPAAVEFKESSDYHMSAWLFGGPMKYREQDVWFNEDGTPKYEKVDCYKFQDGTMLECSRFDPDTESEPGLAQQRVLEAVQAHGPVDKYASGKNKGKPKVHRIDSSTPKTKWYERLFQCTALIDLDLLPKEIRKAFNSEFTGKRKLADESPVYSTGKDCIDVLSKRSEYESVHGVLAALLEYAKLDKDLGTYYLREVCDADGNVVKQSGMLQYLTPENIVHHSLNATSTVTGRLSSNRPNMQNIPRGDTSDVKNIFTSRFGDDGVIIEADYSALEVVTLAAFSKDKNLVQALLDGIDMHCMRLSEQLGEPYADVLMKCKDDAHPEHTRYKSMRTMVKPKAFAYQYGATAHGIAFATGCSVEDAQAFIDAEKALFPGVEAYYDEVITPSVERSAVRHREEYAPGQFRVYATGVWQAPGGTCYEFRQHLKVQWVNGQRTEVMQFKPTQLRNYPIQGESGFFVQGIAGLVVRWLIAKDFFGGKVCIVNQVHDAFYLDCHKSVLHEVASTLKLIMESLPEFFAQYGYDLGVPFPVEVEAGPSMNNKEKVL